MAKNQAEGPVNSLDEFYVKLCASLAAAEIVRSYTVRQLEEPVAEWINLVLSIESKIKSRKFVIDDDG